MLGRIGEGKVGARHKSAPRFTSVAVAPENG